jgi:hypothetical protein
VFLSSSLSFCLGLPIFVYFIGLATFPSSTWLSEHFVGFWSSSCASWGLRFEIQILCFLLSLDSLRGRLRNQVVSTLVLYVMSQ